MKINRILLLTYDNIGDMILLTPTIRAIKENYPNIKIDIFASKKNSIVLKYNPYINKIYIYENLKKNILGNFFTLLQAKIINYDIIIDFYREISPKLINKIRFLRGKNKISPHKLSFYEKQYKTKTNELKIYNHIFGNKGNSHVADFYLSSLKFLGIKPSSAEYDFFYGKKEEKKANSFIQNLPDKKKICLNISAGSQSRELRIIESINIINEIKEHNIILLYHPKDRKKAKQILEKSNCNDIYLTNINNILEVGALINKLDIIISPDTSIIHIACAFNKKLIGIYENDKNNFKRFEPRNTDYKIIFKNSQKLTNEDIYQISEFIY